MVASVCGIHAQVMPAAELSIGVRVDGMTREDVQTALWQKRLLVKTIGLRGTVHLFPANELPLWMAALRKRAELDVKRYQSIGMDPKERATILDAMANALDGSQLTLQELGETIVQQVGSWAGEAGIPAWGGAWPRWRRAIGEAALAGVLCYGPPQGNQVTFVRPDQWTGEWHDADPDESLAEVFRRYLQAYGPATTRDFAQWFNIPPRAARDLATNLGDELEEVEVEGYRSLVMRGDAEAGALSEQLPVRLLPHFDCYVVGCHPRDQLLPPDWAQRVPPRTIASQLQVLLVDGKVAGVWQRQAKGRRIAVQVDPFVDLNPLQESVLEQEASRIGAILGGDASLAIGPVEVRPHL